MKAKEFYPDLAYEDLDFKGGNVGYQPGAGSSVSYQPQVLRYASEAVFDPGNIQEDTEAVTESNATLPSNGLSMGFILMVVLGVIAGIIVAKMVI